MRDQQSSNRLLWQFIGILWILEIIDQFLLSRQLDSLGLQPGNWNYWEGILLMTFLHGNFNHLLNNTIGLAIFGVLLPTKKWTDLFFISICAILGCGLAVMLLGQPGSVHIGASGLVFGWWSYLIAQSIYQRNFKSMVIAILVIVLFGGMIYGVLPGQQGVSWQGHLGGAIGGIVGARLMRNRLRV